jgi:hypothetical protein
VGDKAKTGVQAGGYVLAAGVAAGVTFGVARGAYSAWDHWGAPKVLPTPSADPLAYPASADPLAYPPSADPLAYPPSADPLAYAPTGTEFYGTTAIFATPTPTW